ncbi:tetratricopeptide repeat protein [Acinetobacter sp. YH16044]|uniref:tetratricopeptide repeat protein n=1 Tax=Acinetobacter sp. YH16044 TaxID=2601187 RepID=UPI0015D3CB1B|nr:tetratricopeptide repeat protein [Acinetobacter sp. YH16044]
MGVRKAGVVIPFNGNQQDIERLVNDWLVYFEENSKSALDIEWLTDHVVCINSAGLAHFAFTEPEKWSSLLSSGLPIKWMIFFDFADTNSSYSYALYKEGAEIRCVIQAEEDELYMDGQIQDFEKEWLNFSTRYLYEYVENGKIQKKWMTDLNSLKEEINEDLESYYQYYYFSEKDHLIYHTQLVRLLLIELFKNYVGFEIFDSDYNPVKKIKFKYNNQRTYDDYLSLASRGDIAAQIKLGEMYETGCGVEKNDLTAQGWYQKAADQGDDAAMLKLAVLLFKNPCKTDIHIALDLLNQAVEKGNINARTALAEIYEKGEILDQDYNLAMNLYKQSAKQGCAIAPYKIGLMYELGNGVNLDLKIAKRWYHQAANAFNQDAEIRLQKLIQYFNA